MLIKAKVRRNYGESLVEVRDALEVYPTSQNQSHIGHLQKVSNDNQINIAFQHLKGVVATSTGCTIIWISSLQWANSGSSW